MTTLRETWEETSFQLEKLQTAPACVQEEKNGLKSRIEPKYQLAFEPNVNLVKTGGKYFVFVISCQCK